MFLAKRGPKIRLRACGSRFAMYKFVALRLLASCKIQNAYSVYTKRTFAHIERLRKQNGATLHARSQVLGIKMKIVNAT